MNFTEGCNSDQLEYEVKNQDMPRAGKPNPIGDSAECCLQQIPYPPDPLVVTEFCNSIQPKPGAIRKENDPDVSSMTHGIKTNSSYSLGGGFLNVPQKTFFQGKLQELDESIYASTRKAPLGRRPDRGAGFPAWFNDETTFGAKTVRGYSVDEILNPPQTTEELEKEAQEGGKAHICSHSSDFVGEKTDRKYTCSNFNRYCNFGIPTPHFNDGRNAVKILHWLGEPHKMCSQNATWKRSGDKEKLALQIGKTTNNTGRRRNTLSVPPEHTFGISLSSDQYGAGDLIHTTEPGTFVRSPDCKQSLVTAVRHLLMNVNFHKFPSLVKAFRHYDKKGKGLIDVEDLQDVCHEFNLKVNGTVLHDLLEYCDIDKDGFINFVEFANFLTWKGMMPINENECCSAPVNADGKPSSESAEPLSSQALIRPEDLEPVKPGSSQKTVKTIRRPMAASDCCSTSTSVIGANSGMLTSDDHTYGIPSIRSDLPVPRIKRISDKTNYGDLTSTADVLHPSVNTLHGAREEHFFCPLTKKETKEIFRKIGVDISENLFEDAWKLASMKQPNGEVCFEVFRNILKDIKVM